MNSLSLDQCARAAMLCASAAAVFCAPLMAQTTTPAPTFALAETTGVVSFSLNQSAQLNVLNANPVAGTPAAAATLCEVELEFRDATNALLKQLLVPNISPGQSASLTLNRSEITSTTPARAAIRAVVRTGPIPATGTTTPVRISGCPVAPTLEIYNDDNGNTQLVISDFHSMSPGFFPQIGQ